MEEVDFLSEAKAAALRRPPLLVTAAIAAIGATMLACLAWAQFAVLDVVTRAEGKIIPSRQVQVVQNLEGGILREVLAAEGERVAEGQVVARMDGTGFEAEAGGLRARRLALQAMAARLAAEASGKALEMPAEVLAETSEAATRETDLYAMRQADLRSLTDILAQQLAQREGELALVEGRRHSVARSKALLEQELAMTRALAEQGLKSKAELLRLERQMADLLSEEDTTRAKIPAARAAVNEARRRIEERQQSFRSQSLQELTRARAEIAALQSQSTAAEDKISRREVRAPMAGIVKRIALTTRGGVLQPGTPLMEIVPQDDALLVEGKVKPQDVAFLHPGQSATIRVSAFDSTIYGSLTARLEHISADTITDRDGQSYYLVRVRTDPTAEKKFEVMPGMTATVDILTGRQSVMDYLLKPIRKAHQTALRER